MVTNQIIAIMGSPGSGKGTQGKALAETLGAAYVSTGEYCERLKGQNSEDGAKMRECGTVKNVPYELIWPWVEEQIRSHALIVLDGAPRNLEQFFSFMKLVKETGHAVDVIYLVVTPQDASNRMLSRFACSSSRTIPCLSFAPSSNNGR
jgi:adenylate kinase